MVQIIEEGPKRQKFSDMLLQGVGNVGHQLPKFFGEEILKQQQARENEQLSNLTGHDLSGIQDPRIKQEIVKQQLMGQTKLGPKIAQLQSGLKTVQRMRDIGSQGRLGKTLTRGIFGGKQARERGEYEQLGKSLISLASTIPIRNKAEFETLAENLYNPSLRDAEREGILDAMQRIIEQGLGEHGLSPIERGMQEHGMQQQQERPPLSSFHR